MVAYIERNFPRAKTNPVASERGFILSRQDQHRLAEVLGAIESVDERMLMLDGPELVEYMAAVASIRQTLKSWENGANIHFGPREAGSLHPVVAIRDILAGCPDSVTPESVSGLEFIPDSEFREMLRGDLGEAYRSLWDRSWKAATVLAGSVLEALLLWAVETHRAEALAVARKEGIKGPPTRWDLWELTKVAHGADLIRDSSQGAAELARDFRNLIHPGRSKRLEAVCNEATAHSALAAVLHTVNDLEKLRSNEPA